MTDFARERNRALERNSRSRRTLRFAFPFLVALGIVILFTLCAQKLTEECHETQAPYSR